MPRARRWTLGLGGVIAAMMLLALVLFTPRNDPPVAYLAVVLVCVAAPLVAALFVSRHAPETVVGPLLAALSLAISVIAVSDAYGAVAASRALPHPAWLVGPTGGSWMGVFVVFALLVLYFPDGRLPGPRWRVVPVGLCGVFVVFDVGTSLSPGRYQPPWQDVAHPSSTILMGAAVAALPVFLVLLAAAAASVVVRYRRGGPVQRRQIRWLASASLAVPATLALSWLSDALGDGAEVEAVAVLVLLGTMCVVVPATIALAVIRHDLYDVDRAVVVASVYAGVGVVLLAVFAAVSAGVGLVAARASTVVAVGVTAAVAVALGSVRGRLVDTVGRRLYPERARALSAVATLQHEVTAGSAVPEQLEAVLRAALHDPGLRVGYAAPGHRECVDQWGRGVEPGSGGVAAVVGGHQVGVIVPGEGIDDRFLPELVEASALLIEMGRLRIEVTAALRDVEASRSRLVRAGYEERRRLELDLHDGAQQRLVSLGMSLRLAQRHLDDGTVDVDQVLDGAVAEIGTAVVELRQIAHGLRPSSLDDGLAAALENLSRNTPVPVGLDLQADDLPDDVSTTAYFVASEAVANAVKHAGAGSIAMSVRRCDGAVRVSVRDDGCGGAVARPGSGLAGLRDRVSALGGTLGIRSDPGLGTEVEAVLPCES